MVSTALTPANSVPDGPCSERDPKVLPGTTIVRGKVNQKIVKAATTEILRVSPDDVKVSIFDDQGQAGLNITTLIRYDDVLRCAVRPDQSVYEMVKQARGTIAEKVAQVAGLNVGRVNVLLSGIRKIEEKRGLQ